MNSYNANRYERLLELLDEYLTQDFGDGPSGLEQLKEDIRHATGEMVIFPKYCLENITGLRALIE